MMSLGGDSSPSRRSSCCAKSCDQGFGGYLKIEGGMDVFPARSQRVWAPRSGMSAKSCASNARDPKCARLRERNRTDTITADRAVIAIPFSALRRVQLDQPFSS